jgi:hypothetical protein
MEKFVVVFVIAIAVMVGRIYEEFCGYYGGGGWEMKKFERKGFHNQKGDSGWPTFPSGILKHYCHCFIAFGHHLR